jgi:hypothetical protein
MPIDIDELTESELVDLNHRIVARLRFLHEMHSHESMLEFRIGERVTFHPDGRPPVAGVAGPRTACRKPPARSSHCRARIIPYMDAPELPNIFF